MSITRPIVRPAVRSAVRPIVRSAGALGPGPIPPEAFLVPESKGDAGFWHPEVGYFMTPILFVEDLVLDSMWVGAVVNGFVSITIQVSGAESEQQVFLAIAEQEDFRFRTIIGPVALDATYNLAKFEITTLKANTRYYVRAYDGEKYIFGPPGTFLTPASSAHSFSFATASCASTGADVPIFEELLEKSAAGELGFFMHTGDLHYEDLAVNNEALFQNAYNAVFSSPSQAALWRNLPMFYMWDDHDFGPNDTDRDNPAKEAAIAAYRRRVPHPPLANTDPGDPIYFSWVRGRIRFIVTDQRSERAPKGEFETDDPDQVVFTDEQRDWFFAEMLAAKTANQAICWVCTKPWIAAPLTGADHWGGYAAARAEVAAFISTNDLGPRMFIVSGDMHAIAYDDGTNNDWGGFPVCHAAPLYRSASRKGGPYTAGPFPASGSDMKSQVGILDVTDTGGATIAIRFRGIEVSITPPAVSTIHIDESFTVNPN
jgi:phosphodiesterase/alkaline phosphatase D-like protein